MARLFSRIFRLLKFGAVAGAAVGVGKLLLNRRRQTATSEAAWPTIAETAARNGQPVEGSINPDDNSTASEASEASEASAGEHEGEAEADSETTSTGDAVADPADTTETADGDDKS